jgi:hypothetical protein
MPFHHINKSVSVFYKHHFFDVDLDILAQLQDKETMDSHWRTISDPTLRDSPERLAPTATTNSIDASSSSSNGQINSFSPVINNDEDFESLMNGRVTDDEDDMNPSFSTPPRQIQQHQKKVHPNHPNVDYLASPSLATPKFDSIVDLQLTHFADYQRLDFFRFFYAMMGMYFFSPQVHQLQVALFLMGQPGVGKSLIATHHSCKTGQ